MQKQPKQPKMTKPPVSVALAIGKIQAEVTKLKCDSKNNYANYEYVSTDGYYEFISPLLAKHHLSVIIDEKECQLSQDGKTYKVKYQFTLLNTETGEVWEYPFTRTMYMAYSGAQTMGACLSYADKFFLRTLFKIPTGEQENPALLEANTAVSNDADAGKPANKGQEPKQQNQGKTTPKKDTKPQTKPETTNPKINYDYSGQPYRVFDLGDNSKFNSHPTLKSWATSLKASAKASDDEKKRKILVINSKEIERILAEIPTYSEQTEKEREGLTKGVHSVIEALGGKVPEEKKETEPENKSESKPEKDKKDKETSEKEVKSGTPEKEGETKTLTEMVRDGEVQNLGG